MYTYSEYLQPIDISLKEIIKKLPQKEIFGIFFPDQEIDTDVKIYKAPYRNDNIGTCYFRWYEDTLYFVDFASGDKINIDCILMVKKCLNIGTFEALNFINSKYNLESVYNSINVQESNTRTIYPLKIRYVIREYNQKDAKFWFKYGITKKQLLEDKVYPITGYQTNNRFTNKKYNVFFNDLGYVYTNFQNNKVKIYRPNNKDYKWFTNCNQNDIGNITDLPEKGKLLIITKSYKDCRVLKNLGLNSIWLQNEGMLPHKSIFEDLINRFKKIIVFFDNDSAGQAAMQKLLSLLDTIKPNISKGIFLPPRLLREENIKDPSDLIASKGVEALKEFLEKKKLL